MYALSYVCCLLWTSFAVGTLSLAAPQAIELALNTLHDTNAGRAEV